MVPAAAPVVDNRVWPAVGLDVAVEPMTQMSRLLVERLLDQIRQYFKGTSADEHVCMFLNPFVLMFGMDYLIGQRILPKELKENCRAEVLKQIMEYFGPDKVEIFGKIAVEHERARAAAAAEAEAAAVMQPDALIPGSPIKTGRPATTAIFQQMQRRLASQTAAATVPVARSNMSLRDKQKTRYEEERKKIENSTREEMTMYEEYFKGFISDVDDNGVPNYTKWMEMIQQFPSALALKEMKGKEKAAVENIWLENFCPMDAVYSTKRFDIVGWWMNDAHGGRFRYLQGLAVVHLAQPFTNAYVERVFSRGTWIDGARSQRVLDSTFEMRVLDADNRRLVELAKPVLDLTDIQNNVDVKVHDSTAQKIKDALARFAEPLDEDDSDDTTTSLDGDEYIDTEDATKEITTFPTGDEDSSEGEDDEGEGDGSSADENIFSDIQQAEFDKDVNDLLRHMAASKQKPPPSFKKPPALSRKPPPPPPPSAAPALSKKRGRKSI
jgi:soluble cytochrome b562